MMSPQRYLMFKKEIETEIERLESVLQEYWEQTLEYPIPVNLRPMTPNDVAIGQVVWYPDSHDDESQAWEVVERVLRPDDDWKAFESNGARHGLRDAFVEE